MSQEGKVSSFKVSVIIPAAGQGLRFGGRELKQFKLLGGKPLLTHALEKFDRHPAVDEIILAVPADKIESTEAAISSYNIVKPLTVIAGGARRQDSVQNGVRAASDLAEIVVIHDAGRPFVSDEMITAAIDGCRSHDGAIVALQSSDTVKLVESGGHHITKTIPRETVWLAQTPQAFRKQQLLAAFDAADIDGVEGTDEAALLERIGYQVAVVPGNVRNFKITTKIDWQQATAIIEGKDD